MIMSLQEIKDYLGITDNSQDNQLQFELDYTEDFIRDYTYNCFYDRNVQLESSCDFVNTEITFLNVQDNDLFDEYRFRVDQQIEIVNSLMNDGIYTIVSIAGNVLTINETLITENYDDTNLFTGCYRVDYPDWLKKVQAMMIEYDLNTQGKDGVKKETISRHSIEWGDLESSGKSYPASILSKLKTANNVVSW